MEEFSTVVEDGNLTVDRDYSSFTTAEKAVIKNQNFRQSGNYSLEGEDGYTIMPSEKERQEQ